MGNMYLAATTKSSNTDLLPFLIIVVLFGLLYVVMIRPQRNRQRQAMQMQSSVVPGQRIRTSAGIYGTVVSVQDNDVEVEIAPGVRIRMLRRAVMDIVPGDGMGGSAAPTSASSAESPADGPAQDIGAQDRNF
jgi:preprotein translocase subunit YajC